MPQIKINVGTREHLNVTISKATPMGLLGTEAIVQLGQLTLYGPAAAMRALGEACDEAAAMAESYDSDPATYDQRERGEAIERR